MNKTWARALVITAIIAAVAVLITIGTVVYAIMSTPDDKPTGPQATTQATQQLLTRPGLEDSEARLQSVVQQIATAGSELVPGMGWNRNRDREVGGCDKPFDQTEGRIVYLPNYISTTPITDAVWPAFVERARTIAARIGATAPETMQDKPGNHEVWFTNPDDGTTLKIGTQVATVISGVVGCHLPHDKFNTAVHPTH